MLERFFKSVPSPDNPISPIIEKAVEIVIADSESCSLYDTAAGLLSPLTLQIDERPADEIEGLFEEWINGLRKIQALHKSSCLNFENRHALRSDL